MEEKDKLKLVSDYAIEFYKSGFNCGESVYAALMKIGAIQVPPESLAMCTGFGGGIGLSGNTCGALCAAIMANSSKYGRPDPMSVDSSVRKSEIAAKYYRRYNNLVHEFEEKNGSATCKGITGGYADWECKERRIGCLKLIGATAQLAYKYLQIPQEEAFKLPYGENMRK